MDTRDQARIIDLLRFDGAASKTVPDWPQQRWKTVLEYCDRHQLTMPLAAAVQDAPPWLANRLHGNQQANRVRQRQMFELHASLGNVDHLVLKGFAHWPYMTADPELRTQYDIDLYCPRETIDTAVAAACALGYETLPNRERFPTDHLPPLIRKTGWEWHGDFFDLDIPAAIELHYRFWDRATERFGPTSLDEFWLRRERRRWRDWSFTALNEGDTLGYACLHALRHLLRGDLRAGQFFEIAWFLHRRQDTGFWTEWHSQHAPELRLIEALGFRFAHDWFGCALADGAQAAVDDLSPDIRRWFEVFGRSPLESAVRANKDELWLHLSLLDSAAAKAVVLRRRLLPLKPPGAVDATHVPDHQLTFQRRLRRSWRYVVYVAGRLLHHCRASTTVLHAGARWWLLRSELTPSYWRFYAGALVFNLSLLVFYLLYNLHLSRLGFDESFIGRVTAAMHVGSLAGSLVAAWIAARIGLRPGILFCFVACGILCTLRSLAADPSLLIALALAGGAAQSLWAVCLAPSIAALTSERARATALALTFGTGVGLGVIAGGLGGRLPAVLGLRGSLLAACALAPLAVLPLIGLRIESPSGERARRVYAWNPFLARFLGALSLWGLATGAFNPFFNVYFSRALGFSVETIGGLYSAAQLAQVVAMVVSPLVLRRFGIIPAIALMQVATAIALAGLGVTTPLFAGWIYGMYMATQYMSEPGLYSLLMSNVEPEQRTGASALNFVVLFGTQAIAAWLAGEAIAQTGYRPTLLVAAVLALLAAAAMTRVIRS